jgi:N-acetylmuramoyl-L-alanine amidase
MAEVFRWRSWLPIALAALAPVCAERMAGAELKVTAVRFWVQGDATKISIEVSGAFKHRYDRLSNPDRAFWDILDATPTVGAKGGKIIPVGDARLKQIRVAETQPGVTRIVLDLEEDGAQISASVIGDENELLIEVRPPKSASRGRETVAAQTPKPALMPASLAASTVAGKEAPKPAPSIAPLTTAPKPTLLPAPDRVIAKALPPASIPGAAIRPIPPPPSPTPAVTVKRVETARAETPATKPGPTPIVAAAAKRTSVGDRTLTRALGLKIRRVVLDAGHGGNDHGTTGPTGLTEKELTLDVTRRLGALLEDELQAEVIYTRTGDDYVALEERPELANRSKADLFLSIHANSSPYKGASGSETFYLSLTASRPVLELAARENATSQKSVAELQDLLQKIALKDKVEESREFALRIQSALYHVPGLPKAGSNSRDRGVKRAPFVVLIGTTMPAVLAEIGFMSNPKEEALLKKPEYRQKLAEALLKGITQYQNSLSHFVAQRRTPRSE